ncbi:MAG TPA: serine/threonine-protein kinase [Polyangiaceae bacterium]
MVAPSSPSQSTPFVGAGFDTFGGATFVQARLALLGKTVFLLAFGFFCVMNTTLVVGGGLGVLPALLTQANVFHFLAALVMAAVWAIASRGSWSLRTLGMLDALSLFLAGLGLAAMAAQPDEKQLMAGLFALTVTMMARAVLIPSTARRTLCLSSLAAAPLLLVSLLFHHPQALPGFTPGFLLFLTFLNALLWMMISVSLSTVTSNTIYGLRRQVKEASAIGPYVLEEKIGSGGMGEVWRARHRMLIRPAAVKLVKARELGSDAGRDSELRLRRFEREARATAGLKSPHTVELYDFGVAEDGSLYYVMELLEGMDLDTLVERFGPLPAERAIHLLSQLCASLDDAHCNGVVHRDIKPANLIVSRIGSEWDFLKVLDFGLVKLESAKQKEEGVNLTSDGNVSGTPGFIAPEVVLGTGSDHRVDLYAVGCVAYWLVTGKLVFEGTQAIKVMFDHVHTAPVAPSSNSAEPIPPELDALILECLEKDPDKRPASAAALRQRFRAIPVAQPWSHERGEKWWSENAPGRASTRPLADVVLSQEANPLRELQRARG